MTANRLIYLILGLSVYATVTSGQSSTSQKPASPGAEVQSGGEAPTGGDRFSIESEMLIYKAVKENSEALACDVARHLNGETGDSATSAPCKTEAITKSGHGVVIVSSTSPILADFQVWRADMAAMNDLERRASKVCVKPGPELESKGTSGAKGILDLTPADQAFSLLQSALGLLASNQSMTSVVGTVKDQALMNEVARQLRALNVPVLIPELYNPFALSGTDFKNSLYLANLQRLFASRESCEAARASASPNQAQSELLSSVIKSIDAFLAITNPGPPTTTSPQSQGRAGESTFGASTQPPTTSTSHFAVVFAADGLARALGFKGDGSDGPSPTWQHVLWVKALESGGTVSKKGNAFTGTKVRFSGGAVATYALFTLDGNLESSGNLYKFEHPVRAEDIEK